MTILVDKRTSTNLAWWTSNAINVSDIGGLWRDMLDRGDAALIVVPDGKCEHYEWNGTTLVLNSGKKQDHDQAKQQKENVLQRLKALREADLDTPEKMAKAIVDIAKAVRRLAKGD